MNTSADAAPDCSLQFDGPISEFNVNHKVFVRLTDLGRELHQKYWQAQGASHPQLSTNPDGWTAFQLWELMLIFGAHMQAGKPCPFSTSIRLDWSEEPLSPFAHVRLKVRELLSNWKARLDLYYAEGVRTSSERERWIRAARCATIEWCSVSLRKEFIGDEGEPKTQSETLGQPAEDAPATAKSG